MVEQVLSAVAVRYERGCNHRLQLLELSILGRWQKSGRHRIYHCVVEIDLVLEEGTVEFSAAQRAKLAHCGNVRFGQPEIAGRRRRHLQRSRQITALLADVGMITHQHFSEFVRLFRAGLADGQFACLYIISVGCVKNCYDRGVIELGGGSLCPGLTGYDETCHCCEDTKADQTARAREHSVSR